MPSTVHETLCDHPTSMCARWIHLRICWVPAPAAWSSISSLAVSWSYLQQNNSLWISFQQQLWKGTTRYDSKGDVARLDKATKAKFEESTGNLCRKALPSSQGVTTAFMDVPRWFWVEIPEQVHYCGSTTKRSFFKKCWGCDRLPDLNRTRSIVQPNATKLLSTSGWTWVA